MTTELPLEALITHAQSALAEAVEELQRRRNFDPFTRVVRANGESWKAPLPGEMMESGGAKSRIFDKLAKFCRAGRWPALLIVTDAWTLIFSEEQNARLRESSYREAFNRLSGEKGLAAAAAAGFGTLAETVTVTAQTEHEVCCLSQVYQRVTPDGVIPPTAMAAPGVTPPAHTIRLHGEPAVRSTATGWKPGSGRLFALYKGGKHR